MFKNIQKYLLINYPLLWNTKIIPMSILLIIVNIIFFFVGIVQGKLNFFENDRSYSYDNDGVVVFFSILISVLLLVLWIVFYLKNNSFKSFYPKTNFSLFKEWCIILFISFLISLFTTSFYYGKDVRIRNYFSEKEARDRCEILSKVSYFVEGSYSNNYNSNVVEASVESAKIDSTSFKNNFIIFNEKNYDYFSLLNKNLNSYTFFDFKKDSIRERTVKNWLVNQQKDSIKLLFKKYLAIAKEHDLKANIDENKWFDLIYDYPKFENYREIGSSNLNYEYYENNNQRFDSLNKYIKVIKGVKYEYFKYYVPEKSLSYNYNKISDSWVNPSMNFATILIAIYFSIGLSLLLFSFRVTSGRNWLIAIVSLGILGIVFGILGLIIHSDYTFIISLIIISLIAFIYFISVVTRKKSKGISAIVLNILLWLIPYFLPLFYFITLEILKDLAQNNNLEYTKSAYYPTITFMKDNTDVFFYINLLFIVIMMVLLSKKIKQWRGLAEA